MPFRSTPRVSKTPQRYQPVFKFLKCRKKARKIVKKATTKKEVMTYEVSIGFSKRILSTLTYTRAPNLSICCDFRRTSIVRWYKRHFVLEEQDLRTVA